MAVYKVPQDVEAEDKLVGPFTFRQFIFLIVAVISAFLTFQLFKVNPLLTLLTLPPLIVFGTLGVYRRPDQPAELYLLALLRFFLKPHKRIWDQEGIIETVHITAPKRQVHHYTDGLSQVEVKSRLDNLARLMDSRGWSTKNVALTTPLGGGSFVQSDRLIMPTQQAEPSDVHAADDIMDVYNNPLARDVQARMQTTQQQARDEAVEHMREAQANPAPPVPAQTVSPATSPAPTQAPAPEPTVTAPTQAPASPTSSDADAGNVEFNPYPTNIHQRVVSPISSGQRNKARQADPATTQPAASVNDNSGQQSASTMTQPPSDAILRLANNSDLRVSTIAKEAARIESMEDDQTIKLH